MWPRSDEPFSLAVCALLIRAASLLEPPRSRHEWREQQYATVWHRWQFLAFAGEWSFGQSLLLLRQVLAIVGQAILRWASDHQVNAQLRKTARLPGLVVLVCLLAVFSLAVRTGGFPATRSLIHDLVRNETGNTVLLWIQPFGDLPHGIPTKLLPFWRKRAGQFASFAAFAPSVASLSTARSGAPTTNVSALVTDAHFLPLLHARAQLGRVDVPGTAAIDYDVWQRSFGRNQGVLGTTLTMHHTQYKIAAVLAPGFHLLSRQPTVYICDEQALAGRSMVLARLHEGTSLHVLIRTLKQIAADSDYYYLLFHPRIQSANLQNMMEAPLAIFLICILASGLLVAWACHAKPHGLRAALGHANRMVTIRRAAFFVFKLAVGWFLVFAGGLEWARPQDSVLLPWTDGGSGPFLSWVYVLGAMAVFFLAVADQRARCPVCLRSLAFPVRIGSPGSLFLNWSGTELYCSEGHGMLHIPHMFTSWEEQSHRWIGLEESWRALFKEDTRPIP